MTRLLVLALLLAIPGLMHALRSKKFATVEGVTEYRLDNVTRVLLFAKASQPTVMLNMAYLVGSGNEWSSVTPSHSTFLRDSGKLLGLPPSAVRGMARFSEKCVARDEVCSEAVRTIVARFWSSKLANLGLRDRSNPDWKRCYLQAEPMEQANV